MWHLLADANGISGSSVKEVGTVLAIPQRSTVLKNNADTIKPYNLNDALGSTAPTAPPPSKGGGCGGIAQIVVLVVAAVVTAGVATAIVNPFVGAFVGGVAGSVAGQVAGNVLGVQDGFSLKQAVKAGVGSAVTFALPGAGEFAAGTPGVVARAVVANVATQGISVVVGLQKSFDWRGVVAAGAGAAAGELVGGFLKDTNAFQSLGGGQAFAQKLTANLASSAASTVAQGGKLSVRNLAVDAFGNTIGSALSESLAAKIRPTRTQEQDDADELKRLAARSYSGLPDEQRARIAQLAKNANVDPLAPKALSILKAASETGLAIGQELSAAEVQRRSNAYLFLAGASFKQISEINRVYGETGVLRAGRVDILFQEVLGQDSPFSGLAANPLGGIAPEAESPRAFIGARSIDTGIIGTGKVLEKFGSYVESNPIAKYTLLGLDVAAGPVIYAVRNFGPVADLAAAAQDKVAGFFSDGLQGVGRSPEDAQRGGLGGTAVLGVGIGGFGAALKSIKNLVDDLKTVDSVSTLAGKAANQSSSVSSLVVPGRVQSRINLRTGSQAEGAGFRHVVNEHFSGKPSKSQFSISQDELRSLLQSKAVVQSPVTRILESANGPRYVREIDLGRPIGTDKFNNKQPTSIITILTDQKGNLVTTTPGKIK